MKTADHIDPQALRAMVNTMSSIMPSGKKLDAAMAGAAGAAAAITGTGSQLDQLLGVAAQLARVTAAQTDSITDALSSAQTIIETLVIRKTVLTRLTDNLRTVLSQMARTFPQVPIAELTTNLVSVTATLKSNVAKIDRILTQLPPALRTVTDATGNGNWADVASPSAVIPDNMLCVLGVMRGCS